MVKREINDKEGTIDCHYFSDGNGILCMITQVIDGEFASDNLLFAGHGKTHKEARQNALIE
jgi:hypothetical protein